MPQNGVIRSYLTYLANNFIIFQDTPGDIDTVVVPVGPRHMLVDISIDARHIDDSRRFPSAPTIERCAAGSRGARPCDEKRGGEST